MRDYKMNANEIGAVKHMYDVVALGELLIDFTPEGKMESGNPRFVQNAGGAPANVLAALSALGRKTAFIGKVGDDSFGHFLRDSLEAAGIHASGLVFSAETPTTLAFVHLDSVGDRSFSFYRNPGSDATLMKAEVADELLENSRIFHFGSLSLTHEAAAEATLYAAGRAKQAGKLISFDPNLRERLWDSLTHAGDMIRKALGFADVVKLSEEELLFLTDKPDMEAALEDLCSTFSISLAFVTLGAKGCYYRCGELTGLVPGYQVQVVDTTGAGDAFLGGVLHQVLLLGLGSGVTGLQQHQLDQIAAFANAVGALATVRKGAMSSMPGVDEVEQLIQGKINVKMK
jgi:fructokinase